MSSGWTILAVLALATFAIKASGPVAVGGRELPDRALAVIGLLAPSLLAALVVVETFGTAHAELGIDARAAGVAAAGAAALVGRSPVVAIVAAAAIAAGLRAVV
jgi:branched-subunit amino acid transport protein